VVEGGREGREDHGGHGGIPPSRGLPRQIKEQAKSVGHNEVVTG